MTDLHLKIQNQFSNDVLETHNHRGDETVVIKKAALIKIMKFLKENSEFQMNVLIDITAVDGLDMKWKPRFNVVYHLYSLSHNHRLRVKLPVEETEASVETLTNLWPVANWLEREVWDMFGIKFEGHPNLKRMLMYEEFEGHALRKDYPYNKRQPLIGPKN